MAKLQQGTVNTISKGVKKVPKQMKGKQSKEELNILKGVMD